MIRVRASSLFTTTLFAGIVAFFTYAIHQDNVREDADEVQAQKQWGKWIAWRDANCHISEWMVGLSESSGKFHQYDNATVYDCNGIKYVIADSVERAAKDQSLDFSQIPKFSDKK
jgi:hypothetical protein